MFVQALPGEHFESLLKRFKRGVEASGVLREYRQRQHFRPAHERRREAIRKAARRAARRGADR